jgi:hypothetical protein
MIAYLSLAKLEQIYGQLTEFDVQGVKQASDTKVKGGITAKIASWLGLLSGTADISAQRQMVSTKEGQMNSFNELRYVLAHYVDGGHIADLEDCIESKETPEGAVLYRIKGDFRSVGFSLSKKDAAFIKTEEKKENQITTYHHGFVATSGICVLSSRVKSYKLKIACSYKYFSDMGSGRRIAKGKSDYSDEDTFDIHPHSGNHHFFAGGGSANFEALIFITGQHGRTLLGSPLVLFTNFEPDFS